MIDRKNALANLEQNIRWIEDNEHHQFPGWGNVVVAMRDAVELLKEQEHSETFIVIDNKTGKEADTYDIALHEEWAKHLCYCDMDGWAIEEDGTLLLVDECGQFAYADRERFKVKWE